jgi:hypothetical protein
MNETTITASISFFKPPMALPEGMSFTNYLESVSGVPYIRSSIMAISTGPTAVPMGQVVIPGRMVVHSADTVNNATLFNGIAGTATHLFLPSSWHFFYLPIGYVPYCQSTSGPVLLEYLLISQ